MTPTAQRRIREAALAFADELVAALSDVELTDRPDRLYTVAAAAERCGIGRSTLYQAIGSGRIRSVLVNRRRLIPADAIRELAGYAGQSPPGTPK